MGLNSDKTSEVFCINHKYRLPSVFSNYFELNKNVHSYVTRRSKDLYVTAIKKNFGKRCIKHKASTLWNQLPEVLKDRLFHLSETLLED